MNSLKKKVLEATEFIKSQTSMQFDAGLVLGTGLGALADKINNPVIIPYSDIPNFPKSTVKFHKGQLIAGELSGKTIFAMQGRFHYYEGYLMQDITIPVRVMHQLGINTLIVTNAAGGIQPQMKPGTIALIKDHINLMGDNPLIGPFDEFFGERFTDMSEPYSQKLRLLAQSVAQKLGIPVIENIFAAISGPSFETPAEIRMLQTLGADSVGMSVIPEVLVARQLGMDVLAISVITDQSLPDNMQEITHEEVSRVANETGPKFQNLVEHTIKEL